jgi:hypothetical protein
MKRQVLLFLLIALYYQTFSQANFQPGLVVVNQDTLRGFINQRDWTRNPTSFEFQKGTSGSRKFTIKEVSFFQIDGSVRFKRFITLISKDEVGLNNSGLPAAATIDTVFMEVLRQGKVQSLFRYKDQIKTRYFILDEAGNAKELVYQLYTTKGGQYVNNEAFKTQLTFAASKSPAVSSRISWLIKSSTYTDASLIKVIDEMNGGAPKESKKISTKGEITFNLGIGVSSNSLSYKSDNAFKNISSASSVTPYFSVGMDYAVRPEVSKMLWRLDLAVGSTSFETTASRSDLSYPQNVDYTFQQLNVSVNPQLLYHIHNGENLKVYLGAGFRATYSSYSKNLYTISTLYPTGPTATKIDDYFALRHMWFSFQLKAGVVIHRRSEIAVAYLPAIQPINQNDGLWAETINSFTLGYHYRFVKSSAK